MAYNDPAEKAAMRLELRRFTGRCGNQEALIQRADSLREVARLATSTSIPYRLTGEFEARDAHRRLMLLAEDRAKELVLAQIAAIFKADESHRHGLRHQAGNDWSNLTGVLGHLRRWAMQKLAAAEQTLELQPQAQQGS